MDGVVEIKLEPLDTVEESQNESKNEASKDNAAIWIKREPVDGEDVPMKPPDSTQCTVKVEPNDALTAEKLNQALDEALPDGSSSKEEKPEASEENESSDTQPKSMASRKRVSVRQIELLVEFLEGHRDLARGRLKSKEASALSSRLWAECAGILNAETDDDQRTAKQWNKWYTDYKCRLLSRIRQIKSNLSSTAGGPGISILLSPLEERLASLLGANMEVTGRTGAPQDEVQINPLSPVLHTASSSPAPALPFECGENGHNITNEYEVVDVAHFPSTQSIESEQVNETIPTRQRTRRLSRLNRQSEKFLMYSYEVTKNIEVVTIDEEERQKEHQETLKSRRHMTHVCEDCAVGYVVEDAYLMHMKVHSKESGDHECDICHTFLKTADMLYRHRLRHYRRYRCLLCWTRYKDKDKAACHVMTEHVGQRFDCDRCGRGFKRPQYLKRHVEQHHTKPLQLQCGVCSRIFHERGWYRSHVRTHNEEVKANTVKLPSTCPLCSRDYKSKASLKRHLASHETEDIACDICYRKCKNKQTLGQHYLKVHNEKYEGAPEETCPQCLRVCATRAMLKRHILRMHTDRTKKYECWHCARLYLTKGEVRAHIMWCHLPVRARSGHGCACGKLFRTPSLLREHELRAHSDLPPPRIHVCEECGKAFANKQVLNRHMKSHSNELYPCNECGVVFKTQPYVKVHYQIKHLNMTRAQIKAQQKLNKARITQKAIDSIWEPGQVKDKNENPVSIKEPEIITVKVEKDDIIPFETE